MSILNAVMECSIDCPSLCNWPINVQCAQCLPQCMLHEIGFDLTKWNIEGLSSRSMCFLCQINVFKSLNPQSWMLVKQIDLQYQMLFHPDVYRNWLNCGYTVIFPYRVTDFNTPIRGRCIHHKHQLFLIVIYAYDTVHFGIWRTFISNEIVKHIP